MNIDHVNLLDIIAAARGRYASLVPESAGHLVLALGRAMGGVPVRLHASEILLNTEGAVSLAGRRDVIDAESSASQICRLLDALLSVSAGHAPALNQALGHARRCQDAAPILQVVTQALIPINRGAAKRALARLARETFRTKEQGLLELDANADWLNPSKPSAPASPSGPEDPGVEEVSSPPPEIMVLGECEVDLVEPREENEPAAAPEPPRPASVPPPLRPRAAAKHDDDAVASPQEAKPASQQAEPTEAVIEPTPTIVEPMLPARREEDEAQAALELENQVELAPEDQAHGGPEAPTSKASPAPAPHPPALKHHQPVGSAPKAQPQQVHLDDPIALPQPNAATRLDELLDTFGQDDEDLALGSAARSLKALAQLDPTPPPPATALSARDSFIEGEIDRGSLTGSLQVDVDEDSGAIAPQTLLSQALFNRRAPLAALAAGFGLLVLGTWLLTKSDASPKSSPAAPRQVQNVTDDTCLATLPLRDLPAPHELLLKLGHTPLQSHSLPTGVRLELIATSPGYRSERIIIPADAEWKQVDGKRIMPLQLALTAGDDLWWPSAVAARVGGQGPRGFLSVQTRGASAELWLVAGAGTTTNNEVVVSCARPAELMVVNPERPEQRRRVRIEAALLKAASKTKVNPIPVMP